MLQEESFLKHFFQLPYNGTNVVYYLNIKMF